MVRRAGEVIMGYILAFIIGGTIGGIIGVFTMCAMVAAGEADDREERWFDEQS